MDRQNENDELDIDLDSFGTPGNNRAEERSNNNSNNNGNSGYNSNRSNYNSNSGYSNNSSGGYGAGNRSFKGGYDKKPKLNIVGKQTINLWNDDKVFPKELDERDAKENTKIITFVLPNVDFRMNDSEKEKVLDTLQKFKNKDYKIRFTANGIKDIYDDVIKMFGVDNCIHISFSATSTKITDEKLPLYIPTDENITAAAAHVKNFFKLSAGIKYAYASMFTSLFGSNNDEYSSYVITFDPYKQGFKLDFTKSRNTANYFLMQKALKLDIYNLSDRDDFNDINDMMK